MSLHDFADLWVMAFTVFSAAIAAIKLYGITQTVIDGLR
jgi:hypothetical protein